MRNNLPSKCVLAILLLLNGLTFTSCMIDVDTAANSTQPPLLPLPSGPYKVTGKIYNYNGQIAWSGPPAPIPSGYISTVDLSAYSPKILTSVTITTLQIYFADLPYSGQYSYFATTSYNYDFLTFDVLYQQFSNLSRYVVSYVPHTIVQKASFHFMTKYNTLPGGTGNDRIVDEYFEEL